MSGGPRAFGVIPDLNLCIIGTHGLLVWVELMLWSDHLSELKCRADGAVIEMAFCWLLPLLMCFAVVLLMSSPCLHSVDQLSSLGGKKDPHGESFQLMFSVFISACAGRAYLSSGLSFQLLMQLVANCGPFLYR